MIERRFVIIYTMFKAIMGTLSIWLIFSGELSRAECPIESIMVNGEVEHAPRKATVRVQLIYPKDKIGESGDVTVEDGSFRIPILFLTQSRAPFLNGSIPSEKCARKPKTVVVSLIANDQEYDRISLDMVRDFEKIERSVYALRSGIILHGSQGTGPVQ